MKRNLHIDADWFSESVSNKNNIAGPGFYLIADRRPLPTFYEPNRPFTPVGGCCLRILRGQGDYLIDTRPCHVSRGDVLLVPENSIIEIQHITKNLDLQLFSYLKIDPVLAERREQIHIGDSAVWRRLDQYFRLMQEIARTGGRQGIPSLQMAFLEEVIVFSGQAADKAPKAPSRDKAIFDAFIALVNRDARHTRKLSHYARELAISPNWLTSVVSSYSGLTPLQWITQTVIQQARVRLAYSDLTVSAIADELRFSSAADFSRCFKRETGQSPSAYRKSLLQEGQE
ncbi:MAG: helix-turn-helix transcriptional regulator [Bacteroidales bacterium]|nr:helix-turn-helix transcriptional regulator [Bacteroidales bacterium]